MKKIGKEIRTVKQMHESVGSWVKVTTEDDYSGRCIVDTDADGRPILLSNDDAFAHSSVFWTTGIRLASPYRFAHYACKPYQITEELKSCVRLTRKPRCDAGVARQQYAGKATKSAKIPETIDVGKVETVTKKTEDEVEVLMPAKCLSRIIEALESIAESLARMS